MQIHGVVERIRGAHAESVVPPPEGELPCGLRRPTRLDLELALVARAGWYDAKRRRRPLKRRSDRRARRQALLQVLQQYNQPNAGTLVPGEPSRRGVPGVQVRVGYSTYRTQRGGQWPRSALVWETATRSS
jgi:hypothetical protein